MAERRQGRSSRVSWTVSRWALDNAYSGPSRLWAVKAIVLKMGQWTVRILYGMVIILDINCCNTEIVFQFFKNNSMAQIKSNVVEVCFISNNTGNRVTFCLTSKRMPIRSRVYDSFSMCFRLCNFFIYITLD